MICKKCHRDKLESEFALYKLKLGGKLYRRTNCKSCLLESGRLWRKNNTERARQREKSYRENNKERHLENKRKDWHKNKEKYKEMHCKWEQANKEQISTRRKDKFQLLKLDPKEYQKYLDYHKLYRHQNWDAILKKKNIYSRKYLKTPKGHVSSTMSCYIRQSIRKKKAGRHWETLVDYNLSQLMEHLESQFVDGMTWENYGEWHIDHIRPISSFNYTKPEDYEFMQCWSLDNLQPLWAADNIKKSNKWVIEAA